MRVGRFPRLMLGAAALLVLPAGCGSDPSGESTATAGVSIPALTSPIPTTTTATRAKTRGAEKKPAPTRTNTGNRGGSAPCSIPDAFRDFVYTGLDCSAAVAVATAWDRKVDACNTVDNPNVEAGFHRTCSVEGFTCTAKRDIHSDARFVGCTQGGHSLRFTWLPA